MLQGTGRLHQLHRLRLRDLLNFRCYLPMFLLWCHLWVWLSHFAALEVVH